MKITFDGHNGATTWFAKVKCGDVFTSKFGRVMIKVDDNVAFNALTNQLYAHNQHDVVVIREAELVVKEIL